MKFYLEKYNLPIEPELLIKRLKLIVSADNFNNYSFNYPYFYFFFVAKYIAEHIEESGIKEKIRNLMDNLHVDENAHIAIFIAHHSRNNQFLNEIKIIAENLFDMFKPATLTRDEVKFFDEQEKIIVKAALPPNNTTAESEREKRLKIKMRQKNMKSINRMVLIIKIHSK